MAVFTSIGLALGATAATAAATGVAVVGTAVGAASTVYSANKQAKATKQAAAAQREATQAQSRSASVQAARDRMKQIREARIRAGAIAGVAGSEGMGMGTSGVAGSIASIGSQTGSNIGQINVTQGFAETASNALQRSADYQVEAQKWQMIGGISKSIFSDLGGSKTIFDAFK